MKHYRGIGQWELYGNVKVGSTGGLVGFYGGTPVIQPTGYGTPTGAAKIASFNAATITTAQLAGVVAAIILDLKGQNQFGA